MRVKSKYRQAFRDGGRVDLPGQTELPIEQPTEAASAPPEAPPALPVDNSPQPQPPQAEQPPQPQRDDATLALQRQIESLKQSEQLQRQRAVQPQQQAPMSREQRLAAWHAQGLSDVEVQFLQNHPAMIDYPEVTGLAANRAQQAGHQRGTDAYFDFVTKSFDAQINHLQEQQAAQPPMQTPTPAFFKPPPGPPGRSAPSPSRLVSAPVSREIPNSTGRRPTPGKVVLTPSEVEAARISGLTVEAYAKQKIEYERQRESGEYRDNREQR